MSKFWKGQTFCLVTGASRGIGQAVAIAFSKLMEKDSAMLLLARTAGGLDETRSLVAKVTSEVKVVAKSVDLSDCSSQLYFDTINHCLLELGKKASDFDHAIIVHNATSKMPLLPVSEMESPSQMHEYYSCNLFSTICLNSQFLKIFNQDAVGKLTVVQISSRAAVKTFPRGALYSSSKAARDMIFRTLAEEEPSISVLNYAPGVVQTQLLEETMKSYGFCLKEMAKNKNLLTPEESAQKLVQILEEGKYHSGDHVDYYDDDSAYESFSNIGKNPIN